MNVTKTTSSGIMEALKYLYGTQILDVLLSEKICYHTFELCYKLSYLVQIELVELEDFYCLL